MQPKLCTNCKHARRGLFFTVWDLAKCKVSHDLDYLAVSDDKKMAEISCRLSRKYGPCGMDAKLWAPRRA